MVARARKNPKHESVVIPDAEELHRTIKAWWWQNFQHGGLPLTVEEVRVFGELCFLVLDALPASVPVALVKVTLRSRESFVTREFRKIGCEVTLDSVGRHAARVDESLTRVMWEAVRGGVTRVTWEAVRGGVEYPKAFVLTHGFPDAEREAWEFALEDAGWKIAADAARGYRKWNAPARCFEQLGLHPPKNEEDEEFDEGKYYVELVQHAAREIARYLDTLASYDEALYEGELRKGTAYVEQKMGEEGCDTPDDVLKDIEAAMTNLPRKNPSTRAAAANTLGAWLERHPSQYSRRHGDDMQIVHDDFKDRDARAELWHLDDFVVTSVSGGAIWLAPRAGREPRKNPNPFADTRAEPKGEPFNEGDLTLLEEELSADELRDFSERILERYKVRDFVRTRPEEVRLALRFVEAMTEEGAGREIKFVPGEHETESHKGRLFIIFEGYGGTADTVMASDRFREIEDATGAAMQSYNVWSAYPYSEINKPIAPGKRNPAAPKHYFYVDGAGPWSLQQMLDMNEGDDEIAETLKSMRPGERRVVGGGAAAERELRCTNSMSNPGARPNPRARSFATSPATKNWKKGKGTDHLFVVFATQRFGTWLRKYLRVQKVRFDADRDHMGPLFAFAIPKRSARSFWTALQRAAKRDMPGTAFTTSHFNNAATSALVFRVRKNPSDNERDEQVAFDGTARSPGQRRDEVADEVDGIELELELVRGDKLRQIEKQRLRSSVGSKDIFVRATHAAWSQIAVVESDGTIRWPDPKKITAEARDEVIELLTAPWTEANTVVERFEERDNLNIRLLDARGWAIVDVVDDEARDMFSDGFLDVRDLHGSLVRYANEHGLEARR